MAKDRSERDLPRGWSDALPRMERVTGWTMLPKGTTARKGDRFVMWYDNCDAPNDVSETHEPGLALREDFVPRVKSFGSSPAARANGTDDYVLILFRHGWKPGRQEQQEQAHVRRDPNEEHARLLRFFGTPAARWGDQTRFKE